MAHLPVDPRIPTTPRGSVADGWQTDLDAPGCRSRRLQGRMDRRRLGRRGNPRSPVQDQIASLMGVVPEALVIGIDIPIGLPHSGGREADLEARKLLGPRRSSVFMTPSRSALGAMSYAEATALARRDTGKGLSKRAFARATRVFEVDAWVPSAPCEVYEVHPEVSFAMLLRAPAQSSKRTWAGMVERRRAFGASWLPRCSARRRSCDAALSTSAATSLGTCPSPAARRSTSVSPGSSRTLTPRPGCVTHAVSLRS